MRHSSTLAEPPVLLHLYPRVHTIYRCEPMSHYCALLSLIFTISFVALFDCRHLNLCNSRFCKEGLLSQGEIEHLRSIFLACQD